MEKKPKPFYENEAIATGTALVSDDENVSFEKLIQHIEELRENKRKAEEIWENKSKHYLDEIKKFFNQIFPAVKILKLKQFSFKSDGIQYNVRYSSYNDEILNRPKFIIYEKEYKSNGSGITQNTHRRRFNDILAFMHP